MLLNSYKKKALLTKTHTIPGTDLTVSSSCMGGRMLSDNVVAFLDEE